MNFQKIFWIVFTVITIIITIVVAKIIFDSVYPAITGGYKPALIIPMLSNTSKEISNTERYGYITSNEVWSGEIHVTGDIIVPNGVTLTIKPRTKVLVSANSDRQNLMTVPEWQLSGIAKEMSGYIHEGEPFRDEPNHVTIWIAGTLNAIGTKEEKIIIKSDSQNPGRYDWNTLHIGNGIISYAEIRDYRAMDLKTGAKLINSELHNVGECPICMRDSMNILIENNWVHDSGHEVVDNFRSSPIIINNRFGPSPKFLNPGGHNTGWGGLIVGSGYPIIKNNTFEGFNDAVSFFDKDSYEKLGEQVRTDNEFKNVVTDVWYNSNPD